MLKVFFALGVIILNFSVSAQINVTPTSAGCKKSDGKATISVTNSAVPTGNFEYSLNSGPFQNSNMFQGLGAGKHLANVRDIQTLCVFSQEFVIQELPEPNVEVETPSVTVDAVPPAPYCNNASASPIYFKSGICGTTFTWKCTLNGPNGPPVNIGFGTTGTGNIPGYIALNSTTSPTVATVSVKGTAQGKTGPPKTGNPTTFTITVNPTPTLSSPPPTQTVCSDKPITGISFTSPNNLPGTVISWQRDNTTNLIGIPESGAGNISGTLTNTTDAVQETIFTVIAKTADCSSAPAKVKVIVNPLPKVIGTGSLTYTNGDVAPGIVFKSNLCNAPTAAFKWTSDINVGFGVGQSNGDIFPFTAVNPGSVPITATVTVKVTAGNCVGEDKTFTVTVNPTPVPPPPPPPPKSFSAKLKSLVVRIKNLGSPNPPISLTSTLNIGSTIPLTPPFDESVINYIASVDNNITSIAVTPTTEENATIKVNGVPVATGMESSEISLSIGSNVINIEVTSEDGSTIETYTVNVSRAAVSQNWYVDDGSNNGDRWTAGSSAGNDLTGDGTVSKPFRTLNKAMSAANAGDNIYVDAGTYTEYINITKSLKIYGPNFDQSPNKNPSTRLPEAVITAPAAGIIFNAYTNFTNIELKGFKLLNGSPLTDGSVQRSPDQDIVILFEKNWVNHGNSLSAGSLTRWKTVFIIDNHFTLIDKTSTSSAIQIEDNNDPLPAHQHVATVNIFITDNKIETTNFGGILLDNISYAIVQRNIIKFIPHEAIQLAGGMGNVIVSENDIRNSNITNVPDGGGIRIYGSRFSGIVNIRNNFVTNNTFNGFVVKNTENITNPNIHVNNNSFTNLATGSYAIYHGGSSPGGIGGVNSFEAGKLDVECNWYGSPEEAEVVARIFGPVDYTPWLSNGSDGSSNSGFQPSGICNGGAYVPIAIRNEPNGLSDNPRKQTKSAVVAKTFHAKIIPNPTTNNFALRIESAVNDPATVHIMDAAGRILEFYPKVAINSILKFGNNLIGGMYYAQIVQGTNRKMIKLVKLN